MVWVKVAAAADVGPGKMIGAKGGGKTVLVANVNGKAHAIWDRCNHNGCALSRGTLEGAVVTCPCHSSRFDVRDGKLLEGPAKLPQPTVKAKIEGKNVFIDV